MKDYTITHCPVPTVDAEGDVVGPCDNEITACIHIHEDGAEYGVWAEVLSTECGHTAKEIARAEQDSVLGIDY